MPPVPVRDAATVMLLRAGPDGFEVFLQRRVPSMEFAAGMTVFPGGARDPQDADLRATAVREVLEETGVRLEPGRPHPWARWVTPEDELRRYDTLFFVAVLPDGAQPRATRHRDGHTSRGCGRRTRSRPGPAASSGCGRRPSSRCASWPAAAT